MHSVKRSIERIENHFIGEAPEPNLSFFSSNGVIKFSLSSKGLTNQMSLADVAVAFFVDNFPAGCALDMKSHSWKDLDSTEKKRMHNLCGNIKRAFGMVLMHADNLGFGNKIISVHKLTNHSAFKTL